MFPSHQLHLLLFTPFLAFSFLLPFFPASSSPSEFPPPPFLDNSVVADPRVDCGVESIIVWIQTEKSFRGRLYVEDESEQAECVHSYAGKEGQDGEAGGAEFNIRFGQCNMRRQRLLNPRGVAYSFTLVISFHPVFLTGIDRAFNIKCFFMEAVRALDTSVDVSPLSTSVVEREFALPQCSYHLRHGLDGPFLKYASIGQPVTHVWQCDRVAGWLYGVLVHSCFVDDGHGNRFDLIDDRGCVTDRSLLSNIHYDEKAFVAFAHAHVFRYADRVQLFFTCTVQLCFREDGGCDGISPPRCDGFDTSPFPPRSPHAPPPFPRPPGLNRNFFKPPDSGEGFSPPPHARPFRIDSSPSHFGARPPPFKDSPLAEIGGNGTTSGQSLLSSIIAASPNRTTRAGREAEALNERMETDLSADLTVVPRAKAGGQRAESTEEEESEEGMMGGKGAQNPFVRVLPIKREEYSPLTHLQDSQRIGSFEMLTIAGVSFGATIMVTFIITSVCLQRCRMKRMMRDMLCGPCSVSAIPPNIPNF